MVKGEFVFSIQNYARMKKLIFILFIFNISNVFANQIDSLFKALANHKTKDTNYVNTLNNIAVYYMEITSDSCVYYGNIANKLSKSTKFEKGCYRAINSIGSYYNSQSKFELALQFYFDGYKIAEGLNDKNAMSNSMNSIGNAYLGVDNISSALDAYLNSNKIATESNNQKMIGISSIGIGHIYLEQHKVNEALVYYKKANEVFKKLNNNYTLAISYTALANALVEIGKFDEAFDNFNKSILLAQKLNDTYVVAGTYNEMGDALNKFHKEQKALEYYEKSITIFTSRKAYLDLMNLHFKVSEIYKKQRKFDKALENYSIYNIYKDSVFNIDRHKQILEVGAKYETEKKEKEIQFNKLKLKAQQTDSNNTIIGIVIFFIVALILFLIYHTNQLNKEKLLLESTVEKRTKKLQESLKEREFLLKEVHHRVKNNLTLLKSLLYLQAKATDNKEVKIILEECQLRIQSMSIIHQNLMEESGAEKIEFQTFFTQLFLI